MKKIYSLIVSLLLLIPVFSQAQEKKEQLWYCFVETVNPQMLSQYHDMSIELAELAKANDFPFAFHIWGTRDLDYQIWYPINTLNDIDQIEDAWDKLMEKWGKEKVTAFSQTKTKNFSMTMTAREDLFYKPETPRPEVKDAEFALWQEFSLLPAKQKEMEVIIKEANQLLAEHNYNDPWYIAEAGIGCQTPCLFAWSFAKDHDDFYVQDKKFQEELGESFKSLNERFIACVKAVKTTELYYHKKFSYEKE